MDTVDSGSVGLEQLKIKNCNVILTDLQMPNMDGFETTQEIIRQPLDFKTPSITLNANIFY